MNEVVIIVVSISVQYIGVGLSYYSPHNCDTAE